jgi:ABC-type uncharacterized transport system substrate-binding protein
VSTTDPQHWSYRVRLLICFLLLGFFAGSTVRATTIVIVSSERNAAYLEAEQALLGELESGGLSRQEVLQVSSRELLAAGPLSPKLFITLGAQAADALIKVESRVPVLCTLLPRSSFERALQHNARKSSARLSALYLDQPLSRQLELIRIALPAARRIGVLWGVESQAGAPELRALATSRGLDLLEAVVDREELLFPRLRRVLDGADLLLAVPDAQLFNSGSIQNILLTSFRTKVPLVAFSAAYVRAGALMALYVTPAQLGLQAATMARAVLQGKALPTAPVYSQDFEVAVNPHVAGSLGWTLDAQLLREQLRRSEAAP